MCATARVPVCHPVQVSVPAKSPWGLRLVRVRLARMSDTKLSCYCCGVELSHGEVVVRVTDPVEGREVVLIACSGEHLRLLTPYGSDEDPDLTRVWAGLGPSASTDTPSMTPSRTLVRDARDFEPVWRLVQRSG